MNVRLVGRNKQKRYYYQCANHRKKVCNTKPLNAQYIESAILDIVVQVIANTNLDKELKSALKERLALEEGILAKNQTKLVSSKKQLDSYVTKSSMPDVPQFLMNQYEERIKEIAKDIEIYNDIIKRQESRIAEILVSNNVVVTKEELLANRILARSIIRDVIKGITFDESTGDIEIELL